MGIDDLLDTDSEKEGWCFSTMSRSRDCSRSTDGIFAVRRRWNVGLECDPRTPFVSPKRSDESDI